MKITICASIAFIEEMLDVKSKLESMGHEVKMPPLEIVGEDGNKISVLDYYKIRKDPGAADEWIWERKERAMRDHFDKVSWSDCILVLNQEKNNIKGYIGANTLLEMGLALYLNKAIYLYDQVPEISYKEEILGMHPVLINQDLAAIK